MKKIIFLTFLFVLLFLSCNRRIQQYSDIPLSREELIQKYKFSWMSKFSEGKALVYNDDNCFVINEYGEKLFDYPYMGSDFNFKNNYAIVHDGLYDGVIDVDGELIVEPSYLEIRKICPELNRAKSKDLSYGFLDITSNIFYELDSLDLFARPLTTELIWNKKNGKIGLINNEGEVFVPFVYDVLSQLSSGGLRAKRDKKYGIINKNNEILTPFIYDFMRQERKDHIHIIVSLNGKKGVIDQNNNILLPIEYDLLKEGRNNSLKFEKGDSTGKFDANLKLLPRKEKDAVKEEVNQISQHFVTFEENGKIGIKNNNGQIIYDPIFDAIEKDRSKQIVVTRNGRKNLLTKKGELIFDEYFDDISGAGDFVKVKNEGLWGVKTKWNKHILDIAHESIKVEDGVFIVGRNVPNSSLPDFGLFDFNGKERLEAKYFVIKMHKNILIARGGDSTIVLTKNFTKLYEDKGVIYPSRYQDNDYLMIVNKDDRSYLFDLVTNQKSSMSFNELAYISYIDNYHKVTTDNYTKGIIDTKGNLVLDTIYSDISPIFESKKFFKVEGPEGVAIYNKRIEQIIPPIYSKLIYRNDDFIIAEMNGKQGAINIEGNEIVSFNYTKVKSAINKHYVVSQEEKVGLIDSTEKILIDFKYDAINKYHYPYFIVKEESLYGILDISTKHSTPLEYQEVRYCTKSMAIIKQNNLFGLIHTNGESIIPPVCNRIKSYTKRKPESKIKPTEDTEITKYIISFEDYEFTLDPNLKCIKDCPDEAVLLKLNLNKDD